MFAEIMPIECQECGASDFVVVARGKEIKCKNCNTYYLLHKGYPLLDTGQNEPRHVHYIH